jgi:GT2 family glycosyltransferase
VRTLDKVIYVDSGSTDGSQAFAESVGADVVDLDTSVPFTAARARNAGLERLTARWPGVTWVQFVDGDCELVPGWLEKGRRAAKGHPRQAVVCGRRKERFVEASIFNRVCDVEWDTPVGEAEASGGDALMRVEALQEVGGFDPTLIAGEEPELCLRLRRAGWRIERIDAEMTWHDAQMTRLKQWFKRSERAGHAFAEVSWRDRHADDPYWQKEARRIPLYGAVVPAVSVGLALPTLGLSLGLLSAFPYAGVRAYADARARGRSPEDSAVWAVSCAAGRVPELVGWARFHAGRLRDKRSEIIEYK